MSLKRENTTFPFIEETLPILGLKWKEHWLKVLKPETISAFITWMSDQGKVVPSDETEE